MRQELLKQAINELDDVEEGGWRLSRLSQDNEKFEWDDECYEKI